MSYKSNNNLSFYIIGIIVILILLFIIYVSGSEQYNDGICTNCGNTFKYEQAVGHYGMTYYLYICDKCGRTVETLQYYPPK